MCSGTWDRVLSEMASDGSNPEDYMKVEVTILWSEDPNNSSSENIYDILQQYATEYNCGIST